MSSVSRLNGFRPVRTLSASGFNGQSNTYFMPTTDASVVMVGDLVKLAGDGRTPTGVPTITRAVAGDAVVGVVVGIPLSGQGDVNGVPDVSNLNVFNYRRANTAQYVMVVDDPMAEFVAQASAAGSFTTADIGLNVNFRATAGNTTTGTSGMDIDMATKATTATLPLKIIGYQYRMDNAIGDAFIDLRVKINNHQYASGTGTLGV